MKTRFQWIAGSGIVVGIIVLLMGAGTIEDSGIFQSLKLGGKTNLISDDGAALTYNGTHYQISSATLTNASTNAFTGAGLIVLQTAVPANQTNVAAANPTATVSTTAVNGSAGTFMRSDASPAIPAAFIQANQTNETTASITNKLGGFSGATGSYLGADGLMHTVTSAQTNATLASLGGMAATAALTNLNDGIGTGLTNLLESAVTNALSMTPTGLSLAQVSASTGTGEAVLSTSPILTTPGITGNANITNYWNWHADNGTYAAGLGAGNGIFSGGATSDWGIRAMGRVLFSGNFSITPTMALETDGGLSVSGPVRVGLVTNTPTGAFLGAGGAALWSSNAVVYISYSADGSSVTTKQIAP